MFANLTNEEDLNAMVGFTKEEVESIIDYYEIDKKVNSYNSWKTACFV